jgi:myo-inositol-1(or 4)-monophosphatase
MTPTYKQLCLKACETARFAGAFIAEQAKGFDDSMIEQKGLHDLVSYVDREAEKMIIAELSGLLPEAGFIAEEGTSSERGATYNWIIDPLDGTTNFMQGIPVYAVSLALMKENELVVGVVYEIGQQECFYAWKGGGAYLNGTRICVSGKSDLHQALLATGFPYNNFDLLDAYMSFLKWALTSARGVRRLGSAATDLAYVACGRFDAFWEYDLKPWDVAAGALLVEEAGGVVSDFHGDENFVFGRTIQASNGLLHESILSKLKEFMA